MRKNTWEIVHFGGSRPYELLQRYEHIGYFCAGSYKYRVDSPGMVYILEQEVFV